MEGGRRQFDGVTAIVFKLSGRERGRARRAFLSALTRRVLSPVSVVVHLIHSLIYPSGTSLLRLVGRILDATSNFRPTPVQSLFKVCPKIGHVKGLSRQCQKAIQVLSNFCQDREYLDRDWTGKSGDCPKLVHLS